MLNWENKKEATTCGENIDQLLEGLSSNDFADMSRDSPLARITFCEVDFLNLL